MGGDRGMVLEVDGDDDSQTGRAFVVSDLQFTANFSTLIFYCSIFGYILLLLFFSVYLRFFLYLCNSFFA